MDEVERMIKQLKADDFFRRIRAGEVLGLIGDSRAVSALIEQLNETDSSLRINAAKALGEIGDTSAVPALTKLLNIDKISQYESLHIYYALGKIGDTSAVPVLIERLESGKSSSNERSNIIKALGKIGGANALATLTGKLKGDCLAVNYTAAKTLEKTGFENIELKDIILSLSILKDTDRIVELGASVTPIVFELLKDGKLASGWCDCLRESFDRIIKNCQSVEEIGFIESNLMEDFDSQKTKSGKGNLVLTSKTLDQRVLIMAIMYKIKLAQKRNDLSKDKGILLDGKPKPPKRNKIYRTYLSGSLNGPLKQSFNRTLDTGHGTLRRATNG
jgi:HEAT repeat protein